MTWADMAKKYPEYREDMTKDRERDFVKDCFDCYEKEGFAEKFNAIFDTYKEYHGKKFKQTIKYFFRTLTIFTFPESYINGSFWCDNNMN